MISLIKIRTLIRIKVISKKEVLDFKQENYIMDNDDVDNDNGDDRILIAMMKMQCYFEEVIS